MHLSLVIAVAPLALASTQHKLLYARQESEAFKPSIDSFVSDCQPQNLCGEDICLRPERGETCCAEGCKYLGPHPPFRLSGFCHRSSKLDGTLNILTADPFRPDGCPGESFCLTQGYCCPDVSSTAYHSHHTTPQSPILHLPIPLSPSHSHHPTTPSPSHTRLTSPTGQRPSNMRPPIRRHPPPQLRRRPNRPRRRRRQHLRRSRPYDCPLNFRRIASDDLSLPPPPRLEYSCRILNRVIRASVPSSFQRDAAICAGGRGDSFYGGGGESERRCFGGAGGCGCVVALRGLGFGRKRGTGIWVESETYDCNGLMDAARADFGYPYAYSRFGRF